MYTDAVTSFLMCLCKLFIVQSMYYSTNTRCMTKDDLGYDDLAKHEKNLSFRNKICLSSHPYTIQNAKNRIKWWYRISDIQPKHMGPRLTFLWYGRLRKRNKRRKRWKDEKSCLLPKIRVRWRKILWEHGVESVRKNKEKGRELCLP